MASFHQICVQSVSALSRLRHGRGAVAELGQYYYKKMMLLLTDPCVSFTGSSTDIN